jgi:hypothetical protein
MALTQHPDRRDVLYFLGGGALLAAGLGQACAAETRISRLIIEAQSKGSISEKIDFISGALRGTRYLGYTLIGGPQRPEQFTVRDDGFDCVTFCETVLAAARAESHDRFDSVLKTIRYHGGVVSWHERNHYFFEWGQHNVENKVCKPIDMAGSIEIEKNVYWHRALGRRRFAIRVIPSAVFLGSKALLANGRRKRSAAQARIAKQAPRPRRAYGPFRCSEPRALCHVAAAAGAARRCQR